MSSSELKDESKKGRKSVQVNVSMSPYIVEKLKELVEQGYFSSISDALRYAAAKLIAEFEAKNKNESK